MADNADVGVAALSLQTVLEAPFKYEWAIRQNLDERPLGVGSWLPIMALAYFGSLSALKLFAGTKSLQAPLKVVAFVNNVLMCLYSAWCMVATGSGLLANWTSTGHSLVAPFCDKDRLMLAGLDFQMYIFFLSKFWEWFDTFVLVLKDKPVWPPANSQFLLHIFHHTTTATVGWLAWRQELSVAWIGPLSNAFVHTVMYGYYAVVTVAPSVRKYGLYITPVQILQFLICLVSVLPEAADALLNGGARCGATKRCVGYMLFCYLTYLAFFVQMFKDKKAAARAKKRAKGKTL